LNSKLIESLAFDAPFEGFPKSHAVNLSGKFFSYSGKLQIAIVGREVFGSFVLHIINVPQVGMIASFIFIKTKIVLSA
tara:strand:- start:56 stop:289 length:234 start_codon:yes stop_codon:yes gene_type:complete